MPDTTPEPAPLPPSRRRRRADVAATITLEDVQANEELSLYIASADRVMDAMGYTEHGFRHANLVGARSPTRCCTGSGYGEREASSRASPGYLHDVGNALAATPTGRPARSWCTRRCATASPGADLMPIIAAIANHEETEGTAVSPISAAVILADKSDVHRSRVRKTGPARPRHPRPRELRRRAESSSG